MRIGELAEASGVSPRSLRYYEEQGLIRSTRTRGNWREFDEEMIDRVVMIQHLFAAGLRSGTVGELLPCLDAPVEERTGELERLLALEVERLEGKRRDIDRELDVLLDLRNDTALPRTRRHGLPDGGIVSDSSGDPGKDEEMNPAAAPDPGR